ncbi:MAG: PQQ-dependent sugar dehydrogenase [Flavobacteriales bacterium]|nr:PQQ-dependent sugar dehydrogenase [Flavobacteriales bacterium]
MALAQSEIGLTEIASGFTRPVDIQNAGDERLFIAEQHGEIKIIDTSGVLYTKNVLNITSSVKSINNEQGLLGLSFHPNYVSNGYFFVNYSNTDGDSQVSRFKVSTNPDSADVASEELIITI